MKQLIVLIGFSLVSACGQVPASTSLAQTAATVRCKDVSACMQRCGNLAAQYGASGIVEPAYVKDDCENRVVNPSDPSTWPGPY